MWTYSRWVELLGLDIAELAKDLVPSLFPQFRIFGAAPTALYGLDIHFGPIIAHHCLMKFVSYVEWRRSNLDSPCL